MDYTIAEIRNFSYDESVCICTSGNTFYLVYSCGGECTLSRNGGREMFDLFYEIGRYITESLYSYEYKADLIRNA